ncbi:MAG TPA: phage virion morphogenesis protein [Pyrinomonadaceae bacterium]|nr:phage virion morphogenesis protein [Pyrinomonadaceae bacterium]
MADGGIQGLGRLLTRVRKLATDTRHVERPLKAAGVYMLGSIEKNFQQQGRPRWTPHAQSTVQSRLRGKTRKSRRARHKSAGGMRILIDSTDLKNSISYEVTTEGTRVGSRGLPYARRQHKGYQGGSGRGHSPTPARPFLLVQEPEDVNAIGTLFRKHIARE